MKIMGFFLNPSIHLKGGYQEHNRVPVLTLVSSVEIDVKPCRSRAFLWVAECFFVVCVIFIFHFRIHFVAFLVLLCTVLNWYFGVAVYAGS